MSEEKNEKREVTVTESVQRERDSLLEAYKTGSRLDAIKAHQLGKQDQPSEGSKPPSGGSVLPLAPTPTAPSAEVPSKPQASGDKPSKD